MGLQLTKEEAREQELKEMSEKAVDQFCALQPAVTAERAAGIPPVAGTNQALSAAALDYLLQLQREESAIMKRRFALRRGQTDVPPMPEPTPPLDLVPVPVAGATPPEQPCGSCVQPGTPMGSSSSSSPHRQLGSGSSSDDACAASGTEGSEAVQLLAAREAQKPSASALLAGLSAAGLRRRPEQHAAPG